MINIISNNMELYIAISIIIIAAGIIFIFLKMKDKSESSIEGYAELFYIVDILSEINYSFGKYKNLCSIEPEIKNVSERFKIFDEQVENLMNVEHSIRKETFDYLNNAAFHEIEALEG